MVKMSLIAARIICDPYGDREFYKMCYDFSRFKRKKKQ